MNQPITAYYPSNIALVKYWGKRDNQLPCNASLSMTLSNARTAVKLYRTEKQDRGIAFSYYFEGRQNEAFRQKVLRYLLGQKEFSDLLNNYAIRIESENSFPHSAGIASSASAFAAIAAAFLKASGTAEDHFTREASRLARLGSGSACRSFFGPFSLWGRLEEVAGSSDDFAIPVLQIHECFQNMRDTILIVEDRPKAVSSSRGHALMEDHPLAKARFQQADNHCKDLLFALKSGDFDAFISITEREALSLHAMMMTSGDYYLLVKPATIQIIEQVFRFRKETGLPICFSLDAGPNVHLLYPESIRDKVDSFIKNNIKSGLKFVVYDQAGTGGTVF